MVNVFLHGGTMKTTGVVSSILCYLVFLSFSPLLASDIQAPPNILLILADDLGYSDLGCYGGEIRTPHIDSLAKCGVRFTQLYNSARCCPSRASLMTGLYPSQAGIGDFTTSEPSPDRGPGYLGRLNDQCVTLAELLKPAGYGCYYVGKWHMHEETGPIKRGFDEFYGFTRGHSHDQYDADYYIRLPKSRQKEIDPPGDAFYATDVFNDYALEFIRQGQKSGKPWFSVSWPLVTALSRAGSRRAGRQVLRHLPSRLGRSAGGAVRSDAEDWADRRRQVEADSPFAGSGRPQRHCQRVSGKTESGMGFAG